MATETPVPDGHQNREEPQLDKEISALSLSSKTVHADDFLNSGQDVAPPLHVSTTFRYSNNPDNLVPWVEHKPEDFPLEGHIYSRATAPNTTRLEAILSEILKGPSLTYASRLSAFLAALVFLNPKRISIGEGYHGCHGVLEIHQKLTGSKKLDLNCPAEELEAGDVVHVETPLNPYGTAYNLKEFADKAHSRGAYLVVDATFAPPPLQDPFLWGADLVMHSGTKYIGGHSDMLCGVLTVNPARVKEGWPEKLWEERLHLGNVLGSLEGWLGIRSVRTLELRVERQSSNATKLVAWLNAALHPEEANFEGSTVTVSAEDSKVVREVVEGIQHASLQKEDLKDGWLLKQMPNGFGPVFAISLKDDILARRLPSKLALFHHATSLGGVESLIEWRAMSDPSVHMRLLRISVGIEGWEDLRDDLLQGFKSLVNERAQIKKET